MSARNRIRQGFTLVEILIVVVILGILAAIVIPQFTSASETAKASSLTSQLQTIRSQLELYQVQHNGNYPPLVTDADWDKMTGLTDALENEYANAAAVTTAGVTGYGPYLQKAPSNPFITTNPTATAAGTGSAWQYDESTGEIKAVLPATIDATEAADMGLDTVNDVVVTAS